MAQFFTSRDTGVHHVAQLCCSGAVKILLADEDNEMKFEEISSLPTQRDMARRWNDCAAELWVKTLQYLPQKAMKLALNSSMDSLPTNSNLYTWGKKSRDSFALCLQYRQSLLHILNNCPVAMDLRRYSRRHDEVLKVLGEFARANLPAEFNLTIDLPSEPYRFPYHIFPTDMHPDMVWWSDEMNKLWMFELTISYETGCYKNSYFAIL